MRNLVPGAFAALLCCIAPAGAADHVIALSRSETISGKSVKFTGTVTYSVPDASCAPIPLKLVVFLDDLNAKLTGIVRATGVEKKEKCGDRISIRSARISASGGNLVANVEGRVGRQQCIKTKLPALEGLGVTIKNKVVSAKVQTDASIEAVLDPRIEANKLRMVLVGKPKLKVSDEILHELLDSFNLESKVEQKIAEAIQEALNKPKSALQLPVELAGFVFNFDDASAGMVDGHLSLIVTGTSPRTQPLIPQFFNYIGVPAPKSPCP
jgi:hypothetical protein